MSLRMDFRLVLVSLRTLRLKMKQKPAKRMQSPPVTSSPGVIQSKWSWLRAGSCWSAGIHPGRASKAVTPIPRSAQPS
jgi:hypothetical protein